MIASTGIALLLLAALLPLRFPGAVAAGRAFGALGVLALLPSAGASGSWPLVLLAAGAVGFGTPLALACAAAGAALLALRPDASAPLATALAGLGVVAAAGALDATLRARRASGGDPAVPAVIAGALLALALLLVDHQAVLSWTFGVGEADTRVLLPGVGLALGVALVAVIGGLLLLGAGLLAPSPAARRGGLGVLGLAVVGVLAGLTLAFVRALSLDDALQTAAARPIALLVLAGGVLAVLLMEALRPPSSEEPGSVSRIVVATTVAAGLAVSAAVAAGLESWWREGAYATAFTAAAVSAALLGLAALEPEARLVSARHALLLGALLWLIA